MPLDGARIWLEERRQLCRRLDPSRDSTIRKLILNLPQFDFNFGLSWLRSMGKVGELKTTKNKIEKKNAAQQKYVTKVK